MARLRPYALQAYMLVYTPLLLAADAHVTSPLQQAGLGLLTFATLGLLTAKVRPQERSQAWTCVAVATGFEVIGSLVWGVYRYRFHNLPLYVPPGHGMVYLFGLTLARTPLFTVHATAVKRVILGAAGVWAVAGLTVLVPLTGRFDLVGAACLPLFAWFVVKSPRGAVFAAIFIATTELELFGTAFRDWTWLAHQPYTHLAAGNPPSAIAGGYAVIDGSVAIATLALGWLGARLLPVVRGRSGRQVWARVLHLPVDPELEVKVGAG